MAVEGKSGEQATEEGLYVCGDGCERRYYRPGDAFLPCAQEVAETTWVRIEEI